MKKFKVTFFASPKGYFSITNEVDDNVTVEDVAKEVVDTLGEGGFIGNDELTHFYRANTITNFTIEKLEVNNNGDN